MSVREVGGWIEVPVGTVEAEAVGEDVDSVGFGARLIGCAIVADDGEGFGESRQVWMRTRAVRVLSCGQDHRVFSGLVRILNLWKERHDGRNVVDRNVNRELMARIGS